MNQKLTILGPHFGPILVTFWGHIFEAIFDRVQEVKNDVILSHPKFYKGNIQGFFEVGEGVAKSWKQRHPKIWASPWWGGQKSPIFASRNFWMITNDFKSFWLITKSLISSKNVNTKIILLRSIILWNWWDNEVQIVDSFLDEIDTHVCCLLRQRYKMNDHIEFYHTESN